LRISRFVWIAAVSGLLMPAQAAGVFAALCDALWNSRPAFDVSFFAGVAAWPTALMLGFFDRSIALGILSLFANAVLYATIACTLRALWRRLRR